MIAMMMNLWGKMQVGGDVESTVVIIGGVKAKKEKKKRRRKENLVVSD